MFIQGTLFFLLYVSCGAFPDFPEVPDILQYDEISANRSKRQSTPKDIMCVKKNTCIDRVVAGTTNSNNCPPGMELCLRWNQGYGCGMRYLENTEIPDGIAPFGSFPWLVYIRNQTGFTGAGALIGGRYILTAAHKVNLNINSPDKLEVYLGVHDPDDLTLATRVDIEKIQTHPDFNAQTLMHDIAILRLSKAVEFGYQKTIDKVCLPQPDTAFTGLSCHIGGWGRSTFSSNDAPTKQKQVTVPIVSFSRCNSSMTTFLGSHVTEFLDPQSHLCAGGVKDKDVCTQDGGSPLVCRDANNVFTVVGLAIWGKKCGQPNIYGVYVNVPNYREWIIRTATELHDG